VCEQVFGLGNKTYEHYNSMGKYVDKRLEELGGERVYELGLGDDDGKYVPAVCFPRNQDIVAKVAFLWQLYFMKMNAFNVAIV